MCVCVCGVWIWGGLLSSKKFYLIVEPYISQTASSGVGLDQKASKLLSLYQALSDPAGTLKNKIVDACHDSLQMALVCECCMMPQLVGSVYPVTITEPKKNLGPALVYAKMTLTAAKGLNMGLKITKLFFPVVPTIPDGTMRKVSAFTESLGQGTLDAMPEVQSRVAAAAASMDTGKGTSVGDSDYCKRQFEGFLAQKDPTRDYGGLNRVQGQYDDSMGTCEGNTLI